MTSVRKTIQNKIQKNGSHNRLWSYADFDNLSRTAVAKAFSILYKDNIIARASHGYYCLPKKTLLGIVPPDGNAIAFLNAYNKEATFACVSGLSGYNKIGLTTQVPNVLTIACNKKIRTKYKKIRYIVRNKPSSGTELERIILDALNDVEKIPDTTPTEVLKKVKDYIKSGEVSIDHLGKSALKENPGIRHIVGALGMELCMDEKLLEKLKAKVNPNTVVYSELASILQYGDLWRIKPQLAKL